MLVSDTTLPISQNPAFLKRVRRRSRANMRFRFYGVMAVLTALALLVMLVFSIVTEARTAFTRHEVALDLSLTGTDSRSVYESIQRAAIDAAGSPQDGDIRVGLSHIVGRLAAGPISEELQSSGADLSRHLPVRVPLSDDADRYLKGLMGEVRGFDVRVTSDGDHFVADFAPVIDLIHSWQAEQMAAIRRNEFEPAERMVANLSRQAAAAPGDRQLAMRLEGAERRLELISERLGELQIRSVADVIELNDTLPSVLLEQDGRWFDVTSLSAHRLQADALGVAAPSRGQSRVLLVMEPEAQRSIADGQIAAVEVFRSAGLISAHFNTALFTRADSSDPEYAGLLSGLVGSILIVLVTMGLAVPVGIAAAVYLEEFAPRNRFTSFIQVNINNLAAIPSIVFGLLGAAIFVNGVVIPLPFVDYALTLGGGLGRGWPLVGGIVLALMTLPTIIIASRAALGSVPGSVRQAALAMGATRLQTVNHHVLPMAAPGILTGSIIGLAQAIGETAPLLLIGMVAFVGEMPEGLNDRATALPVLIFQWSTRAERAWEPMTSAAIIILLLVMLALNGLAVLMRMRYEKR